MTGRSGAVHRAEAALVLADGAVFEGEAIGARPEGGVATGEAVFNTVLSGYQEVITDPSYAGQVIAFTYPQIGNYGVNPTDDEAARPHCRGVIVRDLCDRPEQLALDRVPRGVPDPALGPRHHRDRHPAAHPPSPRPGGHALRVRHRQPGRPGRPAAASAPSTDGSGPGVGGDHQGDRHQGVGALPGGGLRLRDQRGHGAPTGRAGHRHRWCRPRRRPTRCSGSSPTGSSCPTVRGTRRPCPPSSARSGTWPPGARCRSSGSVSATNCWPPRSAAPPTSSPSVTTAATTRCGGCPPDGSRSPRRTTTSRWPPIHWTVPRSPTSISTTGSSRDSAAGTPRCSACSTTPRPVPAPTMPATCSRSSGS